MKRNLSKIVGTSLLGLSLATLPVVLPASAQTDTTTSPSTTTTSPSGTDNTTTDTTRSQGVDYNRGDRDFDWGWLGLLGLAGLAGLARPKREENVRYRDPDEVSRPGARY